MPLALMVIFDDESLIHVQPEGCPYQKPNLGRWIAILESNRKKVSFLKNELV